MKKYRITDYREGIRTDAKNFIQMMQKLGIPSFPFEVEETGEVADIALYPIVKTKDGLEMTLMYYKYEEITN